MESNIERLSKTIRVMSFGMTVLMVWFHSQPFLAPIMTEKISGFIANFAAVAMCYFFQTTSFLLFLNISSKNVKQKLIRRIKSLLVPYLIWNTVALIFFRRNALHSGKAVLVGFTLDPFDGPTWYVLVIFILAFISPIAVWIYEKNRELFLALALFLIIVSFALDASRGVWTTEEPVISFISARVHFLPNYFLGMIFGLFHKELAGFLCNRMLVIPIGLFVALMFLGWFPEYFIFVMPTFMICVFSTMTKIHESKLIEFFSGCSFLVYCSHGLIHQIGFSVIKDLNSVESVVFGILSPVLTYVLAGCLKLVSSRFRQVDKVTSILSGGRL